jgi:hypothetical protein
MIRHLRIAATEISRENELIKHGISRVVKGLPDARAARNEV